MSGTNPAVHNERVKLSATFLNTVAAGSLVVGIIAPMVSLFLGGQPVPVGRVVALVVTLVVVSGVLHLLARALLKGLRP